MIGYKDLTEEEKGRIRSAKEPLILQTANGRAYAQDETDAYIHDLGIWVVFYILEDSPAVLSLGLLVEEHKFTYLWEPGEVPFLLKNEPHVKALCWPNVNVPFVMVSHKPKPKKRSSKPASVINDAGGAGEKEVKDKSTSSKSSPSNSTKANSSAEVEANLVEEKSAPEDSSKGKVEPPPTATKKIKDAVKERRKRFKEKRTKTSPLSKHNVLTHFQGTQTAKCADMR